jgi:acyl-CoA dehydrogenase
MLLPRTLFTAEHELFTESVDTFIKTQVIPHHDAWEQAGQVSREAWTAAGDRGLLCCAMPTEYGGGGQDFIFSVIVMEQLARAGATGPLFHLHSDIVAPYILKFGSEEQRQVWLPKMATGEVIGAIAISEPTAGSDVQAIQTRAESAGDEYVINGQKVFISNGQLADLVVVAAQTSPGSGARGITLFLVESSRRGFTKGRRLEKIGLKAQDTSELFFADVRIPAANMLGQPGAGFKQLMLELPQERLIMAVRAVATCEAVLDWTIAYTSERKAFGRRVAGFQNTQFKLAELTALVTGQRAFVDRCVEVHTHGHLDQAVAAMAKLVTTELLARVVDECLQLFGGWGYMWEYPIARAYADARQARLAGGSSEMMKQIIARSILPPEAASRDAANQR